MAAMDWRPVAASTWTFKDHPLLTALDMVHLLGLTEVVLWAEGVHLDPRGQLPDLEEVGSALDRLGLWPTGMQAPFTGLDLTTAADDVLKARIDVLKQTLDVAAALDCIHVIVHVDGDGVEQREATGAEQSRSQRMRRAAGALEQLCDYGLELGLTLLIKNQPDPAGTRIGARVEDLLHIAQSVDMPNLGLCFDIAHAVASTDAWEDEWQTAEEHIAAVHLSDVGGGGDLRLPLGAGSIDWTRLVHTLDATSAEIDLILEVDGGEEAVQQSLATLHRIVADDG